MIEITVLANAAVAPNGQNTASKLAEVAGSVGKRHLERRIPIPSPGLYVFSMFMKAAERNSLTVEMLGNGKYSNVRYETSKAGS